MNLVAKGKELSSSQTLPSSARDGWPQRFGSSFFSRFLLMACVLAAECVTATVLPHPWRPAKTFTLSLIVFGAALILFGQRKLKAISAPPSPIGAAWLALHLGAIAVFATTNYILVAVAAPSTLLGLVALVLWYAALALLPVSLAGALFGLHTYLRALFSLGRSWLLAAGCGLFTVLARTFMVNAWNAPDSRFGHFVQAITFRGVAGFLGLFRSDVFSDPATSIIGTDTFSVQIAGRCSGIEGVALMLGLTAGWLFYSRRQLRLTRAWLLVPVSLAVIWLSNIVRIACLIFIGDAGHPEVADGGFHSQAGWILFSFVALCFLLSVDRIAWFRKSIPSAVTVPSPAAPPSSHPLDASNTAAVYLLPFLAILAASFLSGAVSSGFEWLYGLRLLAAAAVLYAYRHQYRRMNWRFDWLGPVAGVFVFFLWILFDHWTSGADAYSAAPSPLNSGLAALSPGQRVTWIAVRITAAVITVPIAEELAFRGYLARRFVALDVENISLQRLTPFAILASSLAFGILHGRMWPAGIAAGVAYALVARARGRLGEAVAAHVVTNALIAVWVLVLHDYALW